MSSGAVARAWLARLRGAVPWCRILGGPVAVSAGLLGCGGGAALLHPAQTLPVDTVSIGAGVSGHFGSSGVNTAINNGQAAASQPLADPATAKAYAEGVLAQALIAPGASPWVSARAGLAGNNEAGLTYTGRSLRLDGRHAWDLSEDWALSVGLGASGILLRPDRNPPESVSTAGTPGSSQAEFEPSAGGFGADVPVLFGYRLLEGFGDVWFGPRLGFEHLSGSLELNPSAPASAQLDLSGNHFWGGLVAGFSLGIPPLWLRFELATAYHHVSGELTPSDSADQLHFGASEASGWTFSPSGAIVGKF
jgi:hypothetical protein